MKKIIILTTAIIRGNYHNNSIKKFYDFYNGYLKNYEIHHIINIDQPTDLIKKFTIYETINLFNKIIPKNIKKEYIINRKSGFLQAYQNLMNKLEEMNLISENYYYWWFEDDWENKINYNIFKFSEIILNFQNSAVNFSEKSSLGSFRAGPLMSGSYFLNFFNIVRLKKSNNTCDPEKQVRRWLSGKNRKNGNINIHRLIDNSNNNIDIILLITNNHKINFKDFNYWNYPGELFNKKLNFNFHIIKIINKQIMYSKIDINKKIYELKNINNKILSNIFNNNNLKYCHLIPYVFYDIGRAFNDKYSLKKWLNIDDNTSYKKINFIESTIGNWKDFSIDEIRLKPKYTMNNKFNFSFLLLIQILPYVYKNYKKIGIDINFNYYSHAYGNYPNFDLFNSTLKIKFKPTINQNLNENKELKDLVKLYHNYCGKQNINDNIFQYYSFGKNFELANKYMNLFFDFDENIIKKVKKYDKFFKNKKTLGIQYGGTGKLNPIDIEIFFSYIDNELLINKYDNIFISTDRIKYKDKLIENYNNYTIIIINKQLKNYNNKPIHVERLKKICKIIKNIKESKSIEDKVKFEMELKRHSAINTINLQNNIIDNFLLSKCDFVIKDHPDELSLCKILNPNLNIKLVKKYDITTWPDSYLDLYSIYKNHDEI